jgi:hypothetical protein
MVLAAATFIPIHIHTFTHSNRDIPCVEHHRDHFLRQQLGSHHCRVLLELFDVRHSSTKAHVSSAQIAMLH